MSKTKDRILKTSKDLFNKLGYDQVTIRMIALKLNMSSGNLNYHYKKREDILEALYFDMVSDFDQRITDLGETKINMKVIREDIEFGMHRMLNYQFFWTDIYNLLHCNKKVKAHFQGVYKKRSDLYFYLFTQLMNQGLMMRPSFKSEHQMLAENMINYANTWLYATALYTNQVNKEVCDEKVKVLLSLLYPYLTFQGKIQFQQAVGGDFD